MSAEEARLIALKLHALHEEDREWIVSQLDMTTRSRLSPLLKELSELGFQLDKSLVSAALQAGVAENGSVAKSDDYLEAESIAAINTASLSHLALVFEQEPKVLFRSLAAIRSWRWAGQFESKEFQYNLTGQASQADGIGVSKLKNAARRALIVAVAKQLDAVSQMGKWQEDDIGSPYALATSKQLGRPHWRRFAPWLS